ncbi:MAG TPA: hypothetical protein VML19_12410 [Verrucomicrobiae bacterium]|nr:hypothetical protein [Verrucomicrobiae bacterium]
MTPVDPLSDQLARLIESRDVEAAKSLSLRMNPASVGLVLQDMAANDRPSVRLLVLDIAGQVPSEGASRAILGRLQDTNLTVRSTANSLIRQCTQKSVVPDLLVAMAWDLESSVKGAIARQVGIAGDASDLPRLREEHIRARDPQFRTDLAAAMARLGAEASRAGIVERLSQPDIAGRLSALRDIVYVNDPHLASNFEPLLADRRNALALPFPDTPPLRVCDITANSMKMLGAPLSFSAHPLERSSDAELQEAIQTVRSMQPERAR